MAFAKPSGEPLPALANVDISIKEGEIIVGLSARSGSQPCFASPGGLIKPT